MSMFAKSTCPHGTKAPSAVLAVIESNQGGAGRHKCVECAYVAGYQSAAGSSSSSVSAETHCQHGKVAPSAVIHGLPDSQAGLGRHKCAVCAYDAGRVAGLTLTS